MQRLQRENAEAQQMEMQTTAADPLALLRAFKEKEAAQAPQEDAEPDEDESDEQEEEVEEEEEPEPEPDSKATSVVAAAPAPAPKALRLEPTSADLLRTLGQRTRRTLLLAAEAEFERCHEPQPVSAPRGPLPAGARVASDGVCLGFVAGCSGGSSTRFSRTPRCSSSRSLRNH